jgi:hypothetical protein
MVHIDAGKRNSLSGWLSRWASARLLGFALAGALLAGSNLAAAQVLVFDRGLPTANLNNAAANRSNVLWNDEEPPSEPPWLPGDDFTLPGSGNYTVTRIRIWSKDNTGLTLRGGAAGGPIGLVSSVYTTTAVTYANSEGYQAKSTGAFLQLYQIDFSVNIPLKGGITYQFFLNGPATPFGSDFVGASLHASTAAFSGSPQQGADDTFLFLDNTGTVLTWNSGTGGGTYCPGCIGTSQNTDGNVQVFALLEPTAIPTLSEWGMIILAGLLALGTLVVMRRRHM